MMILKQPGNLPVSLMVGLQTESLDFSKYYLKHGMDWS